MSNITRRKIYISGFTEKWTLEEAVKNMHEQGACYEFDSYQEMCEWISQA